MIYSLTAIIIAINFLFSAPLNVYAAEVESTTDEYETSDLHDGLYSLQDCLDDIPQAVQQLRDIASSFGQTDPAVTALINAPVMSVVSSFAAVRDDMVNTFVDALKNNRDFMRSIFINPYTKSFEWGRDAGRHGGAEGSQLFYDTVFYDVAPGFYKCDTLNWWESVHTYFTSDDNCFFTQVDGYAVVCSGLSASKTCRFACYYRSGGGSSPAFGQDLNYPYDYNGTVYYYGYRQPYYASQFINKYKQYYTDVDSAVKAFYSFSPSSEEKPNGKGYLRDVNVNINASGRNVYNQNWNEIITNNYTTYGDTFNTTTINNYYYNSSSPDTPNYWYDIYPSSSSPAIEGTYDDLDNIDFQNPNLQTDNGFVSDLFAALPAAISGFIVSMVLLFVVVLFLRG